MYIYHRTSGAQATEIVRDGFKDAIGYYRRDRLWSGVRFTDSPFEAEAEGETLLALAADEGEIARFEWVLKDREYREWLIPAAVVNRLPLRVVARVTPPAPTCTTP